MGSNFFLMRVSTKKGGREDHNLRLAGKTLMIGEKRIFIEATKGGS